MTLAKRVARLEQAEIFVTPQRLLERLEQALNAAALRRAGKLFAAVWGDETIRKLILDDLANRFVRNLSDSDLARLEEELGRIAYGDDTAVIKAAKSRALGISAEALVAKSEDSGTNDRGRSPVI
jgi:hypothetical protein